MVYLDPEDLKWLPFVKTWLTSWSHKLREDTVEFILDLFQRYVEDGLKFVNKKCEQAINQVGGGEKRERERERERERKREREREKKWVGGWLLERMKKTK